MTTSVMPFRPSRARTRGLLIAALLGAACFLLGLAVAPARAWTGYLMAFEYFVQLSLAGALFLSVLTLSSARWATALRRIPEAMTSGLPLAFGMGLLLMAGVSTLYEWSHESVVASDPVLAGKAAYLNGGFFFVRLIVFFLLWIWLSRRMVVISRGQNTGTAGSGARAMYRAAACFLPVFAVTFSLASIDWVQSLEPHWFSTIFGLVTLSSMGTSGLAASILLVLYLRRRSELRRFVTDDHLDDLGKIGIGLGLFWGYIWFCQYMLIWYTNMPEETPYYTLRMQGHWRELTWVNLALNWAVPFFLLMPRRARRSGTVLARVAVVMLVGQVLNLYIQVAPPVLGNEPRFGPFLLGPVLGALALFAWSTLRALARAPIVPVGDPYLGRTTGGHSH